MNESSAKTTATDQPASQILIMNRPSLKSMTLFMHILRVLFFIKGILLLLVSIILLSGNSFLKIVSDSAGRPIDPAEVEDKEILDFLIDETMVLGIVLLTLSILFLFSAWLCKRVINRNRYIVTIEESISTTR